MILNNDKNKQNYITMTKSIFIILLLINGTSNLIHSKVFKEANIISETQVHPNFDNISLDSIIIQTFSKGKDTLRVSIYKEKNSFNQYLDSICIYKETYFIKEKGTNKITLDLTDKGLEIYRENIFVKVESQNLNTRVQTSSEFRKDICDYELFNRVQFFSDNNQNNVYGKSIYEVEVFKNQVDSENEIDFAIREDLIDSSYSYSNKTNIILVDINKDNSLDLIVGTDYYVNDGNGKYRFQKKLLDTVDGINIVCDLDNDENIEILNIDYEGQLKSLTLDNDGEIINKTNYQINDFDRGFEEVLLNDIDNDGNIDIVIKYEEYLQVLINNFPQYSEKIITLSKGINNLDYLNTKIVVNNSSSISKEDSNFIYSNHDYYYTDQMNESKIIFTNDSLFNDDSILFENNENRMNIKRRIFSPKEYYSLYLDNTDDLYTLIISQCNCENNYIFKSDADKIDDYTEKTTLKGINLKNSIFADITNDGYKEIITIEDGKIRIYVNKNKNENLFKNIALTTNYIRYTNHNDDQSYLIPSFKKFGKNQIYGQFSLNDFKNEEEGLISLNNKNYKINNYQFEIEDESVVNQIKSLTFSPNPFNENTTIISVNRLIKKIKIFNNNGVEVFKAKPNSFEYLWNGKSTTMSSLAQGVYYYEIYLEGIPLPVTGQIIKVVEK